MIKRNNKGFTLLELIISIFILSTVISLGYRVINKSTIDVKNQSNINKGQMVVNDMNTYLTKDLEQASSIALFLDGEKLVDTSIEEQKNLLNKQQLEVEFTSYLNNTNSSSSTNNKFIYSYKIRFKDDKESTNDAFSRTYSVEIIKDNKDNCRYSISREETNGILISFITKEILSKKQLPFTIQGNSPYEVSLGYNGKNNKFEKYEFTVASRLYAANTGNEGNGSDSGEGGPGNGGNNGSGEASDYLNYCLNKAQSYINKLGNTEISNLINEILKISSKEKYESNDLDSMYDYAKELIENINNIRNNCDKQYLDDNQQNLNGAENYLNVIKYIIDDYNNQNNIIDRNYLSTSIINEITTVLKNKCQSYPNSVKYSIINLKNSITKQKNVGNNNSTSIGQQVDKQAFVIDNYEKRFDNDIVWERVDKMETMMWSIISKIDNSPYEIRIDINKLNQFIDNDINEFNQFINNTIDMMIEFDIRLKTYIYNNIPVSANIPESLIQEINLNADKVSLELKEANKILIGIKSKLNKVNYIEINN